MVYYWVLEDCVIWVYICCCSFYEGVLKVGFVCKYGVGDLLLSECLYVVFVFFWVFVCEVIVIG